MTIFPKEKHAAIAGVAKTFGVEPLAMKPGIYLDGMTKFIINTNFKSDQFEGMPQVGISDNIGGIDETPTSTTLADKVRVAISEAFKVLPAKEKKAPKVEHDSAKQGQSYTAPKPEEKKDVPTPETKTENKIPEKQDVNSDEKAIPEEISTSEKTRILNERAMQWKEKTNESKTAEAAKLRTPLTHTQRPEEGGLSDAMLTNKSSFIHKCTDATIKNGTCVECGAVAKKTIPIITCCVCGFEIPHAEAMEEFEDGIARKDMSHADCKAKKPEARQAEVMPKEPKQLSRQAPARVPVVSHTQQGTMIKGFTPSLAEIGKIKIGEKGAEVRSSGGATFRMPVKLNHFKITGILRDEKTGQFELDPIMKTLGDSPTELDIQLLFNDPTLNFVTSYGQYQGGRCMCRGDGESAKLPDGSSVECNPEVCPQFASKKCKPNGILSVILSKSPRLGGVYKFRTTSINSIKSILSSMFFLATQTGGVLSMIPLKLTLSPKQVTPIVKGVPTPSTIYVVHIEYAGTVEDLLNKTIEVQTYQSKMRENLVKLEATARNILTAPEAPEDQKDFQEEYYPEQV